MDEFFEKFSSKDAEQLHSKLIEAKLKADEDDEDDDDDDWNEFETDDEDDKDNYWDPSKMYTGWDYLAHFGEDAWNKLSSVGSPSKYCI
ncbi:hypothetical protein GLOIN_2v1764791 [Rhizophagus irregularis DAOM 181602=DAOM 197198]|uniref:Uncharacterized protein n=1 Tax=Rhizophagus irregularis (strain DAOM 181602 / DAOM 197198 / MUCL 43194) TaxID=747089 RepID=A0A2P4QQT0_RHIID|nr:hypothetical protein GLOIN_2v1764791 [Rhizophagus irregularis DAOM 181602=DAOM 197198]POG80019.1 hypothetical protein GLOIN_2v1764791 [Rhizophagus irregularis DAOM 181602=DAOM 197198]|eukprot:XP_025186885.1 hypothetical protein GLOIN_2v1764791 [Rhizophagus irregularis DAOM 181602=DAOM 197198]